MKCKNTDKTYERLQGVLFKTTKRLVIEDLRAIMELINEKLVTRAIKEIKAREYDDRIKKYLSATITELVESIISEEEADERP